MSRVEIRLDEAGHGTVKVDGQDLGNGVCGLTITAAVRERPTVNLEAVAAVDFTADAAVARAWLPEPAHDALVALGWTPPQGTPPPRRHYLLVDWSGCGGDQLEVMTAALVKLARSVPVGDGHAELITGDEDLLLGVARQAAARLLGREPYPPGEPSAAVN